jgi:hypothetical protein
MARELKTGTAIAVESSGEQTTMEAGKAKETNQHKGSPYQNLAENDYLARHYVFYDFKFDQLRSLHQYQHELVQISYDSIDRVPGSEQRFRATFKEYGMFTFAGRWIAES